MIKFPFPLCKQFLSFPFLSQVSGDMFTGPEACRVIGAGGTAKIKPTSLDKWRVFVQSTSYNRVLMPNTGFLYEVDPEH